MQGRIWQSSSTAELLRSGVLDVISVTSKASVQCPVHATAEGVILVFIYECH